MIESAYEIAKQAAVPIPCSDPFCILTSYHEKHKHKYRCPCKPCTGKRSRRKGHTAQNKAFKTIGATEAFRGQMTNEELWSGPDWAPGLRFEIKSGASIPKWLTNAISQVTTAHGDDVRPALIIKPKGTSTYWVVIKLDDLKTECEELVRQQPGELTDERISAVQAKIHSVRAILDSAEKALTRRDC